MTTDSTDGLLTLRLASRNNITTPLPFSGDSYTIDKTPPTILSIARQTPAGLNLPAGTNSVTYRVTYSEPVTLSAPETARFAVAAVNGGNVAGTVTNVSGTGNTRDVTVSINGGFGEFRLRAVD